MLRNYLTAEALAEMDRDYQRILRHAQQKAFERTIPPPPVIGKEYVDPDLIELDDPTMKIERPRYWPPDVVAAFCNAEVITPGKGENRR